MVGLVPDGIAVVQLSARGHAVSAGVVDNAYEAQLDVPAGTHVRIAVTRWSPPADRGLVTQTSQ